MGCKKAVEWFEGLHRKSIGEQFPMNQRPTARPRERRLYVL